MQFNSETIKNNLERNFMGGTVEHKHTIHRHEEIRHIPPHERKNLMQIKFDENDMALFEKIFGDEDTANAAVDIISNAPPEIKILSIQLLKMIEEVEMV